jgi:fatty acid desaturase
MVVICLFVYLLFVYLLFVYLFICYLLFVYLLFVYLFICYLFICLFVTFYQMKNKEDHTVEIIQKSNIKIVERGKIDTSNT